MKKIFAVLTVLFALLSSVYAQDARQRKPATIVQDVLALMPMQDKAGLDAEIKPLAEGAPETVEILAAMMKASDSGVNDKVEYAFNALMQYATDPANAAVVPGIKAGLKAAAEASGDAYNKAFYESLLRLVAYDEAAPVTQPATAPAPALPVYKAKKFAKMDIVQKCDAIYRIGEARDASQLPLVLSALESNDLDVFSDAAVAASKIGGAEAAAKLVACLSDSNPAKVAAARSSLLAFNGDIAPAVAAAAKGAVPSEALVKLIGTRRVKAAAPQVYEALSGDNAAVAAQALQGVVTASDVDRTAALLDAADSNIDEYTAAFQAALKPYNPVDRLAIVKSVMARAKNPGRLYSTLARNSSDEAADIVMAALEGPNRADAVAALSGFDNLKVAPALLECAPENDWLLARYVELIDAYQWEGYKFNDMQKALEIGDRCASVPVRRCLIELVGRAPSPASFCRLADYLDNPDLAYAAAEAIRGEAPAIAKVTDHTVLEEVLERVKKVYAGYKAAGDADAGYAIDEINKLLSETESFTNALTAEEEAQGFELLFDGKDMSKWEGAVDEYAPVNGTINVASYFGDNLYTRKEYTDFIYRFEFRFLAPAVNNGVGIRTPEGVDAAYDAMCEVQILDHDDPVYSWLSEYQVHGSVYGVVPAKRIVHKPIGEWSCEEIVVKGDHVKVTVNGEVIVDANVREACQGHNVAPDGSEWNPYTVDHRNHPGMFNPKGHISFCGHGTGLQFKNIRILDLSK